MIPTEMDRLVDRHIEAEIAGDIAAIVAEYTDDVKHEIVGATFAENREAAHEVYVGLLAAQKTERLELVSRDHGPDFCVTEHTYVGTITGSFPDVPEGARITRRILHVFRFADGLISGESVWMGPPTILD